MCHNVMMQTIDTFIQPVHVCQFRAFRTRVSENSDVTLRTAIVHDVYVFNYQTTVAIDILY